MPQPIHLCGYIGGPLRSDLFRPQFLDHQVGIQGSLRIHVFRKHSQKLSKLAFGCETLAAQNFLYLLADGSGFHSELTQ